MVTIREGGTERRVTAAEAFLLHIVKRSLEGDGAVARQTMAAMEKAIAARPGRRQPQGDRLAIQIIDVDSLGTALEPLRMATKLNRYQENATMMLEPWLVEAALSRLGSRRLSREEQETVLRVTRTPHKVKWPGWWEVRP